MATIQDQADFLREIVARTVMRDGRLALETHMTLTKPEVEKLEAVAMRLERIAPYEDGVRRLVMGK